MKSLRFCCGVMIGMVGCAIAPALVSAGDASPRGKEVVVLLHGIGRTAASMSPIKYALEDAGYHVISHGYPSRDKSIRELADTDIKLLMDKLEANGAGRVHFVTHSLGGILVRQYAERYGAESIGRVVMLAPPNHGSEVAERLRHHTLYRRILGPAGQELGTGPASVPRKLPPPQFEVAVIAGTRTWNPLFSTWLPGADDGTVSVNSTQLEGMRAFRKVPATHSLIMYNREAIRLTQEFLATGAFGSVGERHPD